MKTNSKMGKIYHNCKDFICFFISVGNQDKSVVLLTFLNQE